MEITEVRVKLAEGHQSKLQAFATITIDSCFVVRDLKVIQGTKGLFVAMPSRKLTVRCQRCRCKNHLRAQYCNDCGTKLRPPKMKMDERGRARLHADIAHPINQDCRDMIQEKVIAAYRAEVERSKQEGYKPPVDEFLDAGPEGSDEEDYEPLVSHDNVAAGEVRERSPMDAGGIAAAPEGQPKPPSGGKRWQKNSRHRREDEGERADKDMSV